MEEILFHDLYDYNYSVKVLNALKQRWDTYNSFSCIGAPKEKNMLLYLHDCSAVYTTKSGDRIYANSGDIVFMSPASASFDMYTNFEERGDHFKQLVNDL